MVVVVVVTLAGSASLGTIPHEPCLKVKSSIAISPVYDLPRTPSIII